MVRDIKWNFLTWKCDISESIDLGVTVSLFLQGWPWRCSRRVQEMYKGTQSNTSAAWIALSARNAGRHDHAARRQRAEGSQWSYVREGCGLTEAGADGWCKDSWCPKYTRYPGCGVGWERTDQTATEFPYGKTQLFLKKNFNLFFPYCPTNTQYWSRCVWHTDIQQIETLNCATAVTIHPSSLTAQCCMDWFTDVVEGTTK